MRRANVYVVFRSNADDGLMKKILIVLIALALSTIAYAKTPKPKLTRAKAEAIALTKAKGTVESAELEKEHGALVWSFDIRTASDITEVLVNANDGSIVAVQHENAAQEKAEKAKEAKEKAAKEKKN